MSSPGYEQTLGGLCQTSSLGCEQYEASVASTAPSSQASIFSDTGSGHSSIASSISDDFRLSQDDAGDRTCAQAQVRLQASQNSTGQTTIDLTKLNQALKPNGGLPLSYADVTSAAPPTPPLQPQHQHPRRSSLGRHQKPPSLQRQQDRKTHFVDSLVDSASQMVEVIWPLSSARCRAEGPSGRGVLPLRTYIEETLRRSRTSYSTLQVALYYLVLIKPFVPKSDSAMLEQSGDCPSSRALMCGRRMFLAALILASKYLQDRNYSSKAWSKMSGLSVPEINTNERTFLAKVDFKIHIPDPIFTRWTEIVLRFTPNTPPPPPPGQCMTAALPSWKSIIPLLTPALDKVPLPDSKLKPRSTPTAANSAEMDFGCVSPATPTPTRPALNPVPSSTTTSSQETTPTPMTVLPPRFLEPKPDLVIPPTPALARLGPLPTPQLTPSTSATAASTPAASSSACSSRRPSMSSAMAFAQQNSFNRCVVDTWPFTSNSNNLNSNNNGSNNNCNIFAPRPAHFLSASRRPSITSCSAASSLSSPESMISDRSRSSRASSISSVSTMSSNFAGVGTGVASMAPRADCYLARQATCRNSNNYSNGRKTGTTMANAAARRGAMPPPAAPIVVLEGEDDSVLSRRQNRREVGSADHPIVIADDSSDLSLHGDEDQGFHVVSEKKKLHGPADRHTKFATLPGGHHHHTGAANAAGSEHFSLHSGHHHNKSGNHSSSNSRKRARQSSSRGSARRSDLQEEVRLLWLEEQDDRDEDEDDDLSVSSTSSSSASTSDAAAASGDEDVEIVDLVHDDDEEQNGYVHFHGNADGDDEVMQNPDDVVGTSAAVGYAGELLKHHYQQAPADARRKRVPSCRRLPVLLRSDGSKRFCWTGEAAAA